MKKIVFFGLGAVGSVMACCLYELCKSEGNKQLEFLFVVRNPNKAKQYFFRAPHLLKVSKLLKINDFKTFFQNPKKYAAQLNDADVFINASAPELNDMILKLAIEFKTPYCDLASDMYNAHTLKTLKFSQQSFHQQLQKTGIFGLINVGISPGVTNFLVGEKLAHLQRARNSLKIKAINLYLLEHMDSKQVLFSWSPTTALEELEEKPRYFKNKKLISVQPFSYSQNYEFPHFKGEVAQYPIYQEEILSFHDSFPEINSIHVSSGGSEMELIKNLFQLNLLSKKDVKCMAAGTSIEQIVRMVLPGMQSPKKIEEMQKNKTIKYAQFAAIAEIILETQDGKGKNILLTETTGLSFHKYPQLIETPYSGATYIAYPTGIGAAILLFYAYLSWTKNKQGFSGIIKAEELPAKISPEEIEEIKRKMSSYMIDFVSHTDSFLKIK